MDDFGSSPTGRVAHTEPDIQVLVVTPSKGQPLAPQLQRALDKIDFADLERRMLARIASDDPGPWESPEEKEAGYMWAYGASFEDYQRFMDRKRTFGLDHESYRRLYLQEPVVREEPAAKVKGSDS